MIILITGATHTGKTVLAQRLLEKYHYPYLSIDHLKMGLIRSGQTSLTVYDNQKLTEYLWPIVREIIKTAVENDQNLIVEGCYVPYDWRKDLEQCYLSAIRFICLAMTDHYIETYYDKIEEYSSVLEHRLATGDLTIETIRQDNKACLAGFRQQGETVTLIDEDYQQTIESLLEDMALDKE